MEVGSFEFTLPFPKTRLRVNSIRVVNFKSFAEVNLNLKDFNVVIGANASGKSNFINIFKFLNDAWLFGLDNAISMQGGIEYTRNMTIGASKDLLMEVHFVSGRTRLGYPVQVKSGEKMITHGLHTKEATYSFSIGFRGRKDGYFVREERFDGAYELTQVEKGKKGPKKGKKIAVGRVSLVRDMNGQIKHALEPRDSVMKIEEIFPLLKLVTMYSVKKRPVPRQQLYLTNIMLVSPLSMGLSEFFRELKIYDIDPKLSKRPTLITGKTDLEPDGSNLALVLRNILTNESRRRRITHLINDLLPFVERVSVTKLADKSLLACQRERYFRGRSLPATLISDGTIDLTALIIALYFGSETLVIIEEPERNIHPSLISKLVGMIKDVSERMGRQVIVTTHNPEVVKNARIESLLLAHRNDKGFSEISRPLEKEEVRQFLKSDMGIEELFVQNLLEG